MIATAENAAATILGVKYILALAMELNPLVRECNHVTRCEAIQIPEDAAHHRCKS